MERSSPNCEILGSSSDNEEPSSKKMRKEVDEKCENEESSPKEMRKEVDEKCENEDSSPKEMRKEVDEKYENEESSPKEMRKEVDEKYENEESGPEEMRKEVDEKCENEESSPKEMRKEVDEKYENEESGPKEMKKEVDEKCKNDDENIENDDKNREQEEAHFLRLFTIVLDIIMITKSPEPWFSETFFELRKHFVIGSCNEFDYSDFENMTSFLYRHGSHGAGLARYRISGAISNCDYVKSVLERKNLRIICLGTGPGNDAVGLCSALSELQFPDNLKLTLVDKYEEWSRCVGLAKLLIERYDFGKVSELFKRTKVDLSFIKVDLPGNPELDKDYFQVLKEADVILISKLISRHQGCELLKGLQQTFLDNMKDEALIFIIDTFYKDEWLDFDRIYGFTHNYPVEKDFYKSTALAEPGFGSDDAVTSELPINVIRKKTQPIQS